MPTSDTVLSQKLEHLVKLKETQRTLQNRIDRHTREITEYLHRHPEYRDSAYKQYGVKYYQKSTYSGLSQSLLRTTLSDYLSSLTEHNRDFNVDDYLSFVLSRRSQRQSRGLQFTLNSQDDQPDPEEADDSQTGMT